MVFRCRIYLGSQANSPGRQKSSLKPVANLSFEKVRWVNLVYREGWWEGPLRGVGRGRPRCSDRTPSATGAPSPAPASPRARAARTPYSESSRTAPRARARQRGPGDRTRTLGTPSETPGKRTPRKTAGGGGSPGTPPGTSPGAPGKGTAGGPARDSSRLLGWFLVGELG